MKYPGDILYFLKFVGADILVVAAAVLVIIVVSTGYFLAQRGKKRRD
jgi:hypothetical protein